MFKFLFVSANQGGGGSEELWIQTAGILAKLGHEVLALTEWNDNVTRRKVQLSNLTVTHRPLGNRNPTLLKIARKLFKMEEPSVAILSGELNRFRPNLVIFNSGTLVDGLNYLETILETRIPCVAVTHLVSTDNWPSDIVAAKIRSTFKRVHEACFVSEHNRHLFFLQTGYQLANSHIIRNPFLVKTTIPMPKIETGGTLRLALPARLHPRTKGHDILFEVLARPHWIKRKVEITILGTGSSETTLKLLASNLGIEDKVLFAGHVDDMESVWKEHHGLILPSRHEGLPIAQIEAMWVGRVVIATPAGGIPEVMKSGITGFLATSCDADSLDLIFNQAWSRLNEWESIGNAAAEFIRTIIPNDPAQTWAKHLVSLTESHC
jgi:glycosyltransferase involved in cell wall biosynthesis